jgi:hypothetical protein
MDILRVFYKGSNEPWTPAEIEFIQKTTKTEVISVEDFIEETGLTINIDKMFKRKYVFALVISNRSIYLPFHPVKKCFFIEDAEDIELLTGDNTEETSY